MKYHIMKFVEPKILLAAVALYGFAAESYAAGDENNAGTEGVPYTVICKNLAPEMEGKTVYMSLYDNNNRIDSAKVTDGAFRLEGRVAESSFARLDLVRDYANFIAGEGELTIDFKTHLPETGNKVNMEYKRILEDMGARQERYFAIYDSIRKSSLSEDEKMAEYQKNYDLIMSDRPETLKAVIAANGENGVGEAMAREYANLIGHKPELWQEFYDGLTPWIRKHGIIGRLDRQFKAAIATGQGKMFADLEGVTPDGSKARLSDYVGKGKYVLVDFWASWCGPCIAEAKGTLKPLYEKYGGRDDFMILGLATWDNNENILKAIEKHGLPWSHLMTHGNSAMEVYGISGIPMIILFDPQGRIVERDLRGEGLVYAVEKAIGVKK